jgi:hypothetical protein
MSAQGTLDYAVNVVKSTEDYLMATVGPVAFLSTYVSLETQDYKTRAVFASSIL